MSYITAAEVLEYEDLLEGHDLTDLVAKADTAMDALARSKNVFDTSLYASPLAPEFKEYGILWVIKKALAKYIGKNSTNMTIDDAYAFKFRNVYYDEPRSTGSRISRAVIIGQNNTPSATMRTRRLKRS